jgi:hypothetical protein
MDKWFKPLSDLFCALLDEPRVLVSRLDPLSRWVTQESP